MEIDLSNKELDILTGHLLGDGSIFYSTRYAVTPIFSFTSKHLEYAEFVKNSSSLSSYCKVLQRRRFDKRTSKTYVSYQFRTKSCETLKQFRDLWYPEGKKLIPENLKLNSTICQRWYIDDGGRSSGKSRGKNRYISISTCCHKNNGDIIILLKELRNLGFNCNSNLNGNYHRIQFSRVSSLDFLEFIGKCPVECFKYKWDLSMSSCNKTG